MNGMSVAIRCCIKCSAAVAQAAAGQIVKLCAECIPVEPPRLSVEFDAVTDTLTVEGMRFTGAMLRAMARKPAGIQVKLVKWQDGTVTMTTPATRRRTR